MQKEYVDIVVIIPLEEELIEFFDIFPSIEDISTENILMHRVSSGNPELSMLVVQQFGMGKTHAINATSLAFSKFDAGVVICLGIAGSLSGDMNLGDVCYSGAVIDVLDNSKVVDITDDEGSDTELSPTHFRTPVELTSAMNFIRTQPAMRDLYLEWQAERAKVANDLIPGRVPGPNGTDRTIEAPSTKSGTIACGAVSKSKIYNDKLRKLDRAMLAIETESGGVFSQAQSFGNVPAITIRGISDYADKDKGKLEEASKGGVRRLAASNAASFLKLQLNNHHFSSKIKGRRFSGQSELILSESSPAPDPLANFLSEACEEIDVMLKKLSPEYRLQPRGYRLPLPRVRKVSDVDAIGIDSFNAPISILDALEQHDRVFLSIPRSYPDQSVSWVLAHELITCDIDCKQTVPVVINGNSILSSRHTLDRVAAGNLSEVRSHPGAALVFIIENIPFSSKHRVASLIASVEEFRDCKFVFLSRSDVGLVAESEFISRSGAQVFDMCSISFGEIAHFIQKNFDMDGGESEVVALRLKDTFTRFNLDAHPTYFAGIPKETLSSLLQANRRSELIQLAVDGFLTFLVAGDRADVALSRTTRARFLKQLVVEIHVEKTKFDEGALISFTKKFAAHHDFKIDPISFIQAFIEQGILHFDGGIAQVSLPFIEHYLLASELKENPATAKQYFNMSDSNFDMQTFDIYCEIGAHQSVIDATIDALDAASRSVAVTDKTSHILLDGSINPPSIIKPERTDALRRNIQKAFDTVQNGGSNAKEKQRIIDLSDHILEASGRQARARKESPERLTPAIDRAPLDQLAITWAASVVLLGSGAEHLDALTKRKLSGNILSAGSLIVNEWTREQTLIDFAALKADLLSEENLKRLPGPDDGDEKVRFVSGLVDLIEHSTLSDPVRRVMGFLCEQARHKVLATSVKNANFETLFERMLHAIWLSDIDVSEGKDFLKSAMKSLPEAHFFRLALASHYLARAYWSHSRKDDRLFLLDAAEEALKPLGVRIDKPQVKRIIEKSSGNKLAKLQ